MKIIRAGLFVLLTFAVLLHGAVEVWAESILEIGAAALLVVWAIAVFRDPDAEMHWSALNWPLVGLVAWGAAQLVFGWTVYPYLTRAEVLRWTAYLVYFFLGAQAFREKRHLKSFAWFLLFLGFAVGLFGIVQRYTFNGKLYWLRTLTEGGLPFGPFVNRNHFAGFMELTCPMGLALLALRGIRREQVPLVGLLTVVQVAALFLSGSRGGIAALGFELGLLALLVWLRRAGNLRLATLGIVVLAATALIAWLGTGQVMERLKKIRPGEVSLARRGTMFRGAWHIFLAHPWTGTGAGTLVSVYPRYETQYDGKVVEHAHDDYVEMLADAGIPGGLLALLFLVLLCREALPKFRASQSNFSAALHIGALTACGGLLLHGFVDFNLHIPSNAVLFLLLAFLATSPVLAQEESGRGYSRRAPSVQVGTAKLVM